MAREAAPDVKITEAIAPAAQVHDTYWRPANPEPSPLHQVARSLASLSDDLTSTFNKMDAQQAENMKGQGELAFFTGGMTGQGGPSTEAIGNGHRITMGGQPGGLPIIGGSRASAQFHREFAAQEGYAQGFAMQGRIEQKYSQLDSETKFNMTPEQFDAWTLNEIRHDPAAAAGTANPAMARGLAPQMRELHGKLHDRWSKEATENAKTQAVNTWGKTVTGTLEEASISGKAAGGTDYAQVAANLDALRSAGYKVGLTQDQIDKATASAIIERAKLDRDPKLLDVLDNMKDKDGKPVALNMEINKAKTDAKEAVHGLTIRDENELHTKEEREKKAAHDGALRKVTDEMAKNPNASLDPKDVAVIKRWDPDFDVKAVTMRKNLAEGRAGVEDPVKIHQALRDIYNGGGADAYRRAMPEIHSVETEKRLKDAVSQMEKYSESGNGLFEDPNWKKLEAYMMDAGKGNSGAGQGPAFREPAMTAASLAALNDAQVIGMQWAIQHPNASALERKQFIATLSAEFLKADTFVQGGEQPVYNQPQSVRDARTSLTGGGATQGAGGKGNEPGSAQSAAMANPLLPNGARSTAPAVPEVKGWVQELSQYQDAAPKYGQMKGLSAEHRADIERIAKKTGHDAQWVLDKAWKNLKAVEAGAAQGPQAAPAVPQAPVPETPAGTPGTPAAPAAPVMPPIGGAATGLATGAVDAIRRFAPSLMPKPPAAPAPGQRAEGTDAFPVTQASFSPEQALAYNATEDGLDFGNKMSPTQFAREDENGDMTTGTLSAKYESAGSSATVAHDRTGGWSYGRYQFASGGTVADGSAVKNFIASLPGDLRSKLEGAGGAAAARSGSAEFKQAWKEASKDQRFHQTERAVAEKLFLHPAEQRVKASTGLDVAKRSQALKDVLWSVSVQHGAGGAGRLFANALGDGAENLSDAEIIKAVYEERRKVDIYFRSSTQAVKNSVRNRFVQEERDALRMLSAGADRQERNV